MALSEYKKKRRFQETPEPEGGHKKDDKLHFVIQKHHASRLHYDFRLEMNGVLKSWAVPKGPSLNPEDKRLAVQVEDHPYDYKDFEGIIPAGNYGAGTVIVWDEGTYETLDSQLSAKQMEKLLVKQWKAGAIKIRLNGSKLKGEFALVKMKGAENNAWLLIKHDDKYASADDITQENKSVISNKTLEEVSAKSGKEKKSRNKVKSPDSNRVDQTLGEEKQTDATIIAPEEVDKILKHANPGSFPKKLTPMLATLSNKPFDKEGWEFEVKWDGYRAMVFKNADELELKSRNGNSFSKRFYPIFKALQKWDMNAVVDGEIVAVDDNGIPDFSRLQNWKEEAHGKLVFYIFDILWYEGKDLMNLPLHVRKVILKSVLPDNNDILRVGYSLIENGVDFFESVAKLGLEGVIAKRLDSHYSPGQRSRDWLKIKSRQSQEVVIGGYTRNPDSPRTFSSLLVGVYKGKDFHYAGRVGTGFSEEDQKKILAKLAPLERKVNPFKNSLPLNRNIDITWLKPEQVCNIYFTEQTSEGLFRHPVFIALRDDKPAREVSMENETQSSKNVEATKKQYSDHFTEKQVKKVINGNRLELTNLQKVLWPEEGYTKGDMLRYYDQMAPYILPYLKNRPQSLNRFPNGIKGKNFFQKDVTGKVPQWIEQYPYKVKGERKQKHYMLCNNKAALLYMANLGAIEMNPWSSTTQTPENPTWCILDLDPDTDNTFDQVIEVAQGINDFLKEMKVSSYCKTSGSTGLHIYIPLGGKYTYDQSQLFAKWIASHVDDRFDFTSIERMTDKRKGKVYIDYLQNRPAATLAAPYSLRPKPGATVSMPLHWKELVPGLKMVDFTIENALKRVKSHGDIFKAVLGKGVDLKKILASI